MKNRTFAFVVIASALLQATALNHLRIFSVKPDLLLCSVIFASIFFKDQEALFFSALAGILKDLLSGPSPFGIYTVLFSLSGFVIMQLSKKISLDNHPVRITCVFAVAFLNNILVRLIFFFLGNPVVSLGIFLRILFLEALYTALAWPLAHKLFKGAMSLNPNSDFS